ncbi:DUF1963 domain-containing protein [Myxococcus sp. K15C18031901]|uniref:DUF1963 domain-containing protein n=1 Tax=Myxococcus dinghuensis TaxID=2906761 RepID=UPI0020A73FC2|nr:DUF1963 domain-containing protein [Myxococcus dinghuensis]MCP3102215.1 DUF1963 domain-containing protein [Myxococcus dinghuensis]
MWPVPVPPPELRALLRSRSPSLARDVERFLADAPRGCAYVRSERVASSPLQPSLLHRLRGMRAARPVLGVLDSKFGGVPYVEEADLSWKDHRFLGQVQFEQLRDSPPGMPAQGLFALDLVETRFGAPAFRVRWYPEPSEVRARSVVTPRSVGRWEARMVFAPGLSLPGGPAWMAPLPTDDEELLDAWMEWTPHGFLEDEWGAEPCHRLLGHVSGGLEDLGPVPGRREPLGAYEMLWRIDLDRSADFDWGTNWVYVLVHRDDLAANRLERAVVVTANA